MTFLAPFFLIGGLLIAGPIIAHLIRRTTRERIRFSDTRLLEPSPPRLQRRSRIENWWLLALRCLIVLALAAGFARPFLRQEIPPPEATNTPQHVVAVLDDSASMRREGLWSDAVARVRSTARALASNDRFALLTAGGDVSVLITGERWAQTPEPDRLALVEAALEERTPGWGPTRIDAAVDVALDELAAMGDTAENLARPRIVVISDCTEGARVAGLAGRDWPAGCKVEIARIDASRAADVSLQWLGWATTSAGKRAARVRVLEQSGQPATVTLHLRTLTERTAIGDAQAVPLAAREARVVLVEVPAELNAPLRLDLSGDEEAFNNTLWLVPPQPREFTLPFFGAADANDSRHALFYLTRAVSGWRDPKIQVAPVANTTTPIEGPLVVVNAALNESDVARVRTHVEDGGFALVLLADASVIPTAGALAGEENWTAAPPPASNALLGSIDFNHPLFAPFADPRFSDFTRVRFWRAMPVALPENSAATVVARFDDRSPAVLEAEVGSGRVVIWGSDWTNVASQWVLSTKFVPWLQALIERASGGPPRPNVTEVGEASSLASGADARWLPADAAVTTALPGGPAVPGIYRLEQDGRTRAVALQLPVAESRNEPLPDDTWEQLGVPVETVAVTSATATETKETKVAASDLVTESEQQFWRWLLIAAAILLAVESFVALRTSQRLNQPSPA